MRRRSNSRAVGWTGETALPPALTASFPNKLSHKPSILGANFDPPITLFREDTSKHRPSIFTFLTTGSTTVNHLVNPTLESFGPSGRRRALPLGPRIAQSDEYSLRSGKRMDVPRVALTSSPPITHVLSHAIFGWLDTHTHTPNVELPHFAHVLLDRGCQSLVCGVGPLFS